MHALSRGLNIILTTISLINDMVSLNNNDIFILYFFRLAEVELDRYHNLFSV